MRTVASVAALLVLAGCSRASPWDACRGGDVGFASATPACATPACRTCAAALALAWRDRADPARAAALRVNFMRSPAGAREAFLAAAAPADPYPFEHCTAGLARGASCAGYSPRCVDVLSEGLRSGATTLARRRLYELAADHACPPARAALLASLRRCPAVPASLVCAPGPCRECEARTLAALTLVAVNDEEGRRAELRDLIERTPEPVARAVVEDLGGPDRPDDIDPLVLQRGLRAYCVALLGTAAGRPPFACYDTVARLLENPRWRDAPAAWEAAERASAEAREGVLRALFVRVDATRGLDADVAARLRALPAPGTEDAIRGVMSSSATAPTVYAALRGVLVARGVTGAALPPESRPPAPPPAPPPATPSTPAGTPRPAGMPSARPAPSTTG